MQQTAQIKSFARQGRRVELPGISAVPDPSAMSAWVMVDPFASQLTGNCGSG